MWSFRDFPQPQNPNITDRKIINNVPLLEHEYSTNIDRFDFYEKIATITRNPNTFSYSTSGEDLAGWPGPGVL
jgi:hypothetical protein